MENLDFSVSELSEMEALEIKGGALAGDGIMGQTGCINNEGGCGAGADQDHCVNEKIACGSPVQINCPPTPPKPTQNPCTTSVG